MKIKLSSRQEIESLKRVIHQYLRLPLSEDSIPGIFLESVLAHVRGATRLNTYDFVDVISEREKIGWQVKSTKSSTPVTWKRAKIPQSLELIKNSHLSSAGLKTLGNAIINFCNEHAHQSIIDYDLEAIFYARLVIFDSGQIKYVERKLCDKKNPKIFQEEDYDWRWSIPKKTIKKEQLPALHGFHKRTNVKEWAWHGLGENQLHFSGESQWWTDHQSLVVDFQRPSDNEKLSLESLIKLLATI
jgi:hypothetical protein